jgi:DNA polymerase-3 subunit gamma/tau
MSYQVLARKWRPQRFSEVVGQQHVLTALANGLENNRLHHAYLFSGTRGVGKTSIARLFAKGLNCEHGVTAEPCGECENCRAIEEGRFIDLLEIDAASRTKVEDTRELLDNVQYKPVQGRYKIYLIDEVHMLSRHSFNALLKTLEEPPEYVKFLLATTDPHKLPITILSRCMQFHLKALEPAQIADHLEYLLQQEKIPYQLPALEQLAKAARGSIRDSLSLTDQAIAISNGNITTEIVYQMLGTLDSEQSLNIIHALQLADGEALMQAVRQVAGKGVEWDQLLQDVAAHLHQIAMRQLLQPSEENSDQIDFLARNLAPEDVQFYYQLMLNGRKELPFAPDQRSGVEMTMLRALAFHPKLLQLDKYSEISHHATVKNSHAQKAEQAENTANHLNRLRQQLPKHEPKTVANPDIESNSVVKSAVELPEVQILEEVLAANSVADTLQTAFNKDVEKEISEKSAEQEPSIPAPLTQAQAIQAKSIQEQDLPAETEVTSPALKALLARQKLQQDSQKKNGNLTSIEKAEADAQNSTAVANANNSEKSLELMERLNRISTAKPTTQIANKTVKKTDNIKADVTDCMTNADDSESDDETEIIGEDYHWQWLNPELDQQDDTCLRPSDIKQAILQERTPELVAKVLKLSAERDHWSNIIEQLDLTGMVKQLGLNSLLLTEEADVVKLGLRPDQSNLNNERYISALQQQLSQFYQREVRLEVESEADQSRLTPLEQRRQIYLELGEQAKQALQQDPQLALLQQEFDAQLDFDSIRPVG